MTNNQRPRVVIADDDDIFRSAIRTIIQKECEVVGEADDGALAVELAEELRPYVVLLDITMPLMTGLEAARLLRERMPDLPVIMVNNHTAPLYIDEAFQIGAQGYVFKGSAAFQLPQAIQDALAGKIFRPE